MWVYERFGGENQNFFDFRPSVIYALAAPSTPQEVRDRADAIAEEGGDISVKAIKQLKADHAAELATAKQRNELAHGSLQ